MSSVGTPTLASSESGGIFVASMPVRLRLPELLREHKITAYEVSKRSGFRISMSTIYRLAAQKGRVKNFNAELLEDLCVAFGFDDVGKLLEVEGPKTRKRHGPHG